MKKLQIFPSSARENYPFKPLEVEEKGDQSYDIFIAHNCVNQYESDLNFYEIP